MKSIVPNVILLFSILISCFVAASNASAEGDLKFFQHQHTVIPAGQNVDDVVSISGDTEISGTVHDAVIVVNGDLTLTPSAKITGIVLVIGGKINQQPGARLLGEIYNISFDTVTKNSLLIGAALFIGAWLLRLVLSILLIFLSPIIHLAVKGKMTHLIPMVKESPKRVVTVGFITSILVVAVSILLSLTIIGIPVAFILLLLVVLSFVMGFSVISSAIGEIVPGPRQESSTWLRNGIGAVLLTAGLNIPLFGGLLFLVLTWLSLGLLVLWLKNQRKAKGAPTINRNE